MTSDDKDALLRAALDSIGCGCGNPVLCASCLGVYTRITAALAEQSDGWVKCSERLPEHGRERVLVTCEGMEFNGETIFDIPANHLWERTEEGYPLTEIAEHATHWRPLPPLPKE